MEPTRRQLVQMLAAVSLGGAAVADLAAQAGQKFTPADMNGALALQGREIPAGEVEVIRRALQQSLDDFERVRSFDVDDAFGLPVVFSPANRSAR